MKSKPRPKKKTSDNKPNYKIIFYSVIALIALYFSFTIDWLFIAIAAIMMWLNQKELFKK